MALLLAVTSATPVPAKSSGSGGNGRNDPATKQVRESPGQARKAERTRPAETPQAPVAAEPAAGAVADADARKAERKDDRSRGDRAENRSGQVAGSEDSDSPDGSARGSRGEPAAAGAREPGATVDAAPDAAVATPVATAVAEPAPAAAPVAAPVVPAPAVQTTAPAASRNAASSTRSSGARARARRAVLAQRAAGTRTATLAPSVRVADPPAARPATTRMTTTGGEAAEPRDEQPASPLTRTVVQVLEVIPPGVRLALAALALLGLLLGATTAVQTIRSRRLARQRKLLLADFGILQSAFLPELPERIGGARVTTAYRPAAGLAAGGDFYDAFELAGGRTGVIVGDVAGHGRDAIPLTALVRYNLRAYLEAGLTPRATLDVASSVLAPQLGGRQVTIVVAIFDPGTGRLTYACAGHWPPLLLGTTATLVTACSSPPIGAGLPTGRRQTTVALPPGAAACFATDGLADVAIGQGRRLERSGVAVEFEAVGANGDAADLVDRIVRRSERQPDDMAACIVTALPGGAEHWSVQLEELEVDSAMLHGGHVEQFLMACGAEGPQIARALNEAQEMVTLAGTAILEVRIGEQLLEVRVDQPPAVSLPIARRRMMADELSATG